MKQESIPSPFSPINDDSVFIDELEKLAKSHGYTQIFVAYAEPDNDKTSYWKATSNTISDGMIDYVEMCVEDMKERLKEAE